MRNPDQSFSELQIEPLDDLGQRLVRNVARARDVGDGRSVVAANEYMS